MLDSIMMLKRTWRRAAFVTATVAGACAASGGGAQAGVTVVYDPGTTNETTALTGFSTSGDQMAGMTVMSWFADSSTDQGVWATTGAGAGGATGAGLLFSLTESGDTFGGNWTLTNLSTSSLSRLVIDAGKGDAVFDTTAVGDIEGTPGSARGLSFTLNSGPAGIDITATYRDAVALTGYPPVGDLFRSLDLVFNNGLAAGQSITFSADTDNLKFGGDIQPVPEPSSLVMASTVVLGLAGYARRRKVSRAPLAA